MIVRLMGGLGNQLFQYATGRALAHRHGVPLKLDRADLGRGRHREYALGPFRVAAEFATAEEVARAYPRTLVGCGRRWLERLLPPPRRRYYREPKTRHQALVPLGPDVYLHGYWQTERNFESIAPLLRQELTLGDEHALTELPLARLMEGDDSVSLHVRRGDYVSVARSATAHGTCPPEYYRAALVAIRASVPHPRVFAFSDDPDWVRAELRLDARAIHVSGSGLSAAQELVLMSRCRHHVIANSTFSWWGAWLDARPGALVIAPQRWSSRQDRPPDGLLPLRWHTR